MAGETSLNNTRFVIKEERERVFQGSGTKSKASESFSLI